MKRNPYRPGTASYARQRAAELRRKVPLAEARATRSVRPEARRKAHRQAAAARRSLSAIETRESFRETLAVNDRRVFDSLPIGSQQQLAAVAQHYPDVVPQSAPDPFASPPAHRGSSWRLYYATRAGIRQRAAA